MDFFGDDDEYSMNSTPASNCVSRDLFPDQGHSGISRGRVTSSPRSIGMDGFDLNSEAAEFPNMTSYQELLRSQSAGIYGDTSSAYGGTGRGLSRSSTQFGGRGSREFRAPRTAGSVPRGCRGGRGAAVGRGVPPLAATSFASPAATGDHGANVLPTNAAHNQEGDDEPFASQDDVSPISTRNKKRPNNSSTCATSPLKKGKSPMLKIMREIRDTMQSNCAVAKKVMENLG